MTKVLVKRQVPEQKAGTSNKEMAPATQPETMLKWKKGEKVTKSQPENAKVKPEVKASCEPQELKPMTAKGKAEEWTTVDRKVKRGKKKKESGPERG